MEASSQQYYYLCNLAVFQSMDTCYMLSFTPTMLNTSLYNLNVWNKWDLEHFVASDRGINEGRTC